MNTPFSIVVAVDADLGIGRNNGLPWNLPGDMKHFKEVTSMVTASGLQNLVIMGRKTWESIGRPLPGRRNIVVSRNANLTLTGAEVAGSLDEALNRLGDIPRVFVIGGEQLFTQAFPKADQLYITEIDMDVDGGDTFFKVPKPEEWIEIECTPGSEGDITFHFLTLQRK